MGTLWSIFQTRGAILGWSLEGSSMNLLFLGEVLCEDVFTKIAKLPQATYGFTKYLANIDYCPPSLYVLYRIPHAADT